MKTRHVCWYLWKHRRWSFGVYRLHQSKNLQINNINHNLRKYVYTTEEWRIPRCCSVTPGRSGRVSKSCVFHLMVHWVWRLPNPIINFHIQSWHLWPHMFTPSSDVEIKDLQLSPNNGKSLCYVTGSSVEVINSHLDYWCLPVPNFRGYKDAQVHFVKGQIH